MKKDVGLVYFVVTVGEPNVRVKIGHTRGDVNSRLRNLQCGSPVPLAVYMAFDGTQDTERAFHRTFAPLRMHGEWFAMKGKLRDFMICLMPDAEQRRPADWVHVLEAVELVILANEPIRDDDDHEEYMASADTSAWEWMRALLAADDAEIDALVGA
jgi:hypothetical protein